MKEFDLEKAKAGAPVCTRDGRPARILAWNLKGGYPIAVAITEGAGDHEILDRYTFTGHRYISVDESDADLMVAPIKYEGWVNVYRYPHGTLGLSYHWTKEDADEKKAFISSERRCVATIKIEWEE